MAQRRIDVNNGFQSSSMPIRSDSGITREINGLEDFSILAVSSLRLGAFAGNATVFFLPKASESRRIRYIRYPPAPELV